LLHYAGSYVSSALALINGCTLSYHGEGVKAGRFWRAGRAVCWREHALRCGVCGACCCGRSRWRGRYQVAGETSGSGIVSEDSGAAVPTKNNATS